MASEEHEAFMRLAIDQAQQGDFPYGAVLVKDGKVVVAGFNTMKRDYDPTAHAEINVIRSASKSLQRTLEGHTLYTTCEPCPMCCVAIHKAAVSRIYFGISIKDLSPAARYECATMHTWYPMDNVPEVHGGLLREECRKLFSHP